MTTLRLDSFLPYRLSFTANLVSGHIAAAYEALFGLSIPQWRLIAIVAEDEGTTQAAICARSGMDKLAVSRAARALEARGLVTRDAHDGDGRARRLRLSTAGRRLYDQVAPEALALEAALLDGFSAEEVAALTALLRRLDDAVGRVRSGRRAGSTDRHSA